MKTLHDWFCERCEFMEASTLFYRGAWKDQCLFVRDVLSYRLGLVSAPTIRRRLGLVSTPTIRLPDHGTVHVSGTHHAKSTELPVYWMDLPWATIEMRDNYADWNVAVKSKVGAIGADLSGLVQADSSCLFYQGMTMRPAPWTLDNREHFAFCVRDRYDLVVALHQLQQGAKP
jgi:hypothetical protein